MDAFLIVALPLIFLWGAVGWAILAGLLLHRGWGVTHLAVGNRTAPPLILLGGRTAQPERGWPEEVESGVFRAARSYSVMETEPFGRHVPDGELEDGSIEGDCERTVASVIRPVRAAWEGEPTPPLRRPPPAGGR